MIILQSHRHTVWRFRSMARSTLAALSKRNWATAGWAANWPRGPPVLSYLAQLAGVINQVLLVDIWVFPKIVGFPPKSSILIGFSIFVHHPFWGTWILEAPKPTLKLTARAPEILWLEADNFFWVSDYFQGRAVWFGEGMHPKTTMIYQESSLKQYRNGSCMNKTWKFHEMLSEFSWCLYSTDEHSFQTRGWLRSSESNQGFFCRWRFSLESWGVASIIT